MAATTIAAAGCELTDLMWTKSQLIITIMNCVVVQHVNQNTPSNYFCTVAIGV